MKENSNSENNVPKKSDGKPKKKLGKLPLTPNHRSLAWSPEKHDLKVTQFREEEARKKAMAIVGKCYLTWKRKLQKAIEKGRVKTTQDLVRAAYELHGQVGTAVRHTPGLERWRSFAMGLIEDSISRLIRTDGGTKNEILEYLPGELLADPHRHILPEAHQFTTLEEFQAIPYVKRFSDAEGFVGFVLAGRFVKAFYSNGEANVVGVVMSYLGIGKLPTEQQLREALGKLPEPPEPSELPPDAKTSG